MRRGTTPTIVISTDIDLSPAIVLYLTFAQDDETVFEFDLSAGRFTITEDSISVTLTQEETLSLAETSKVDIQIRARFSDGTAVASNVMKTKAREILKEGVI